MTSSRTIQWFVLAAALLAPTVQVRAAEPDRNARSEAKERFARGLHLFENGDNGGALAEFERAYQLVPNRLVLYNIALVYVSMGKPVEASQRLDQVLADPGPLKPEYLARAKAAKEEQQRRIGQLDVKVNVPATIEIDGLRAGDAPLPAPLLVAAGEHIVGALAPGYLPVRQPVTVAGQARVDLVFTLQPTEAKLAHVTIHCPLPGAEVRVDGVPLGKTPFAASVSVLPGQRVFELLRPGYLSARRELSLSDGAQGEVSFDPDEDARAGAPRGRLRVAAGEGEVLLTIDGRARGVYRQAIEVPAGPHVVKLERAGFEPLERLTDVPPGSEAEVKVSLRPTVETRDAYVSRARAHRRWAIAALVSGALVAGGSAVLALWSNGKLPGAEDHLAQVQQEAVFRGGGPCDRSYALTDPQIQDCDQQMADAQSNVDKYKNLRLGGIIGGAAGAALLGVGVVLLLTSPDPGRYDREESFAATLVPVLSAGPDGASLWLRGRF
jgi:tetratricopeptide (TPR) repeat protein